MSPENYHLNEPEASPGQAPHARPPRADGVKPKGDATGTREEVVGKGSGETAGGSPALCVTSSGNSASSVGRSEEDREGDLSNTPSPKTTTGGEDWLSVNFYVNFPDFDELAELLDNAQEAALSAANKQSDTIALLDEIELNGIHFIVSPRGTRLGGVKGLGMKWRLQSEHGLTMLIANMPEAHKSVPNANITATSLPLMRLGFETVWPLMQDYVGAVGGELKANKLSRVDACADLADVGVDEFCKPFEQGWLVSRARQRDSYDQGVFSSRHKVGRRHTGFAVGKSPLRLRVYDKLLESSKSPEKLACLIASRWGRMPERASRVEIQLSRAKLKQFGVDTVEDWISKRRVVLDKLTKEWFRLTSGPVDRNHADRATEHPIWEVTREAFRKWCGPVLSRSLDPLPTLEMT